MNRSEIDNLTRAVLYEGYLLYPYRRGTKNHLRWTFGGLFPRFYSQSAGGAEPCEAQAQCLLRGSAGTSFSVSLRFLQLVDRAIATADGPPVDQLEIDGQPFQSWQEARERCVSFESELGGVGTREILRFPADRSVEPILDARGKVSARWIRTQAALQSVLEVSSCALRPDLYQITVKVTNQTPREHTDESLSREAALLQSMASAHIVAQCPRGGFVSSIDPPADLKPLIQQCRNIGLWPVLLGNQGDSDCILAAPIILYDYPQVAPQSPGDLFDGTEIDEILSLRILTLSEEEKRQVASLDSRGAEMLRRTERLARDQLMQLHGTMRRPHQIEALHVGRAELRLGDRVRLQPRRSADSFDILLRGKVATITAIEQDYENQIHVAVTIDDDPGADIGAAGKIGHRFYYRLDEIEPLSPDSPLLEPSDT